ncbi:MAG TPA: hypothetical protein PLG73_11270 [Candidatus Sumerlaeota bacterium]|nr:hypothetical protein [Candidatus Sumerlaeota bacterium]
MSWRAIHDGLAEMHPDLHWTPPREPADEPVIDHLGDPDAEARALHEQAALVVSPEWAPLHIEGRDAADYLHRRLSHSIRELTPGAGRYALQLAGDGHFQAELLVYRADEGFVALVDHAAREQVFALIEQYTLMDDVSVERMWPAEAVVGLAGPAAPGILAALLDPPATAPLLAPERFTGLMTVTLRGLPCRIFTDPRWPFPFYHLSIPGMAAARLVRLLAEMCAAAGGRPAGFAALQLARVRAGIPRQGWDLDPGVIPLEARLEAAIDRDKGCFPGQEVIARIANLGHPARLLLRLRVDADQPVSAGDAIIIDEEIAGRITSAAGWPGLPYRLALGYVKWPHRAAPRALVQLADGTRLAASCSIASPTRSGEDEARG